MVDQFGTTATIDLEQKMAWMGKRYEVRLAGFGVIGQDIANLMLTGAYSHLMRPLGYERPEISTGPSSHTARFPRLVILISSLEAISEVRGACRQQKTVSPSDFVVAILIGDLESAESALRFEVDDLRRSTHLTLCFPFPTTDSRAQLSWSQDPVIQTLRALIIPCAWDEYIDFDFNDFMSAFADTSGYVSAAEIGLILGDEEAPSEFDTFLSESNLAAHCQDAAVFVSVRGMQPIRFNQEIGVLNKLRAIVTKTENLILSVVKDYSSYSETNIFVTIFAIKRRVAKNDQGENHSFGFMTSDPASVGDRELPAFLTIGTEEEKNCGEHQKVCIDDGQSFIGRLHAHSDDAEQWILGALLIDPSLWELVTNWAPQTNLDESCFYRVRHQHIFRVIKELIAGQSTINVDSVASALMQLDGNAAEGREEHLKQLEATVVSFHSLAEGIRRYTYIVRERWLVRQKAAEELKGRARLTNYVASESLSKQNQRRTEHTLRVVPITQPIHINRIVTDVVEAIQEQHSKAEPVSCTGQSYGFRALDDLTGGMQPGDLIVLAGQPMVGKSALLRQIVENLAVETENTVLLYAIDADPVTTGHRLIAAKARICPVDLKRGRLSDEGWSRFSWAVGQLHDTKLHIADAASLSSLDLVSQSQQFARSHSDLHLLAIDDALMLNHSQQKANTTPELYETLRELKLLARTLNISVLVSVQLPTDGANCQSPTLKKTDLTPAIFGPADVVLGMYPDNHSDHSQDIYVTEVRLEKHREGRFGSVKLNFQPRIQHLESIDINTNRNEGTP